MTLNFTARLWFGELNSAPLLAVAAPVRVRARFESPLSRLDLSVAVEAEAHRPGASRGRDSWHAEAKNAA